jgi:hypothetical protein
LPGGRATPAADFGFIQEELEEEATEGIEIPSIILSNWEVVMDDPSSSLLNWELDIEGVRRGAWGGKLFCCWCVRRGAGCMLPK